MIEMEMELEEKVKCMVRKEWLCRASTTRLTIISATISSSIPKGKINLNISSTKIKTWISMLNVIKLSNLNIWNKEVSNQWQLSKNRRVTEKRRWKEDWITLGPWWMDNIIKQIILKLKDKGMIINLPPNSHFRWHHHNNTILNILVTDLIHQV